MSFRSSRRELRRWAARRLFLAPRMEFLEARLCLSCTASMDGGLLLVQGDEGDNSIDIRGGGGELAVRCDDQPAARFSGVTRLSVDAGEGDDDVRIELADESRRATRQNPPVDVALALGGGQDAAEVNIQTAESAHLAIRGDSGQNNIIAILIGLLQPAVQKVRTANVDVQTGGDNDSIQITAINFDDLSTSIDAGAGDDNVSIAAAEPRAQKVREAKITSSVKLGDGNDKLQIATRGFGDEENSIDAGAGDDDVLLHKRPGRVKVSDVTLKKGYVNHVELGAGGDTLRIEAGGTRQVENFVDAGDGDDSDAVLIGLLLPAVQKVREGGMPTSVHNTLQLGDGDNHVSIEARGFEHQVNNITAGAGDNSFLIGMLLPAIQKVRDAAAPSSAHNTLTLGDGDNNVSIEGRGFDQAASDISAGGGNNIIAILIGLLQPVAQKVRESSVQNIVSLGGGDNELSIDARGFDHAANNITTGDGANEILIGLLLPAVQKVREGGAPTSAQNTLSLGDGDNHVSIEGRGFDQAASEISAGGGNNIIAILIGLLQPVAQKVRESSAQHIVSLGDGKNEVAIESAGYEQVVNDVTAGNQNNIIAILIGLLQPVAQKVRESSVQNIVSLGHGDNEVTIDVAGYDHAANNITAGDGATQILIGLLLPAVQKVREGGAPTSAQNTLSLGNGENHVSIETAGYERAINNIAAGNSNNIIAILIGLLQPALQKVRDTRLPSSVQNTLQLGDGDNHVSIETIGYERAINNITAGNSNNIIAILIGLLQPALQKVREASAQTAVSLGGGGNLLELTVEGYAETINDISSGDGDDSFLINLLVPAVQKVRAAASRNTVDLGEGADRSILTIDAGDGKNDVQVQFNGGSYAEQKVRILGGAHDDTVGLALRNVRLPGEAHVEIDTGDGSDQLSIVHENVDIAGEATHLLHTGGGDDSLALFWDNVRISGNVLTEIDGGVGEDTLETIARGVAVLRSGSWELNATVNNHTGGANFVFCDGSVRFALRGTNQRDNLAAEVSVQQGRGDVSVELLGLDGDDQLALAAFGGRQLRELSALIDGGDGFDTCSATANVLVVNCEDGAPQGDSPRRDIG